MPAEPGWIYINMTIAEAQAILANHTQHPLPVVRQAFATIQAQAFRVPGAEAPAEAPSSAPAAQPGWWARFTGFFTGGN